MKLREHQERVYALCSAILTGEPINRIIASITPGGGKSLLPQIIAKRLLHSRSSRICWIVPRLTLQEQGAADFMDSDKRQMLGHQLEIRESTNDVDPSRGKAGYITTYYAVGTNPDLHRDEFEKRSYVLVLDEPHHVEENGVWHHALQPLVDRAELVVLMSGTLDRGDRKRIAFIPYYPSVDGEKAATTPSDIVETAQRQSTAFVNYGLHSALQEHAIIPLLFTRVDCRAEWLGSDGKQKSVNSLAEAPEGDASAALYTALNTEYAKELLVRCYEHWHSYRAEHPKSKMLVVASSISKANEFKRLLANSFGARADIATSDDSAAALQAISRFKAGNGADILVTVQMAYEGLDVPAITHIACLTHIRSRPWIHQMLARATRFDKDAGPWEGQWAHAFVPDDPQMRDVIQEIEEEQASSVRERRGQQPPHDTPQPLNDITPLQSEATREREGQLIEGILTYEETARMRDLLEKYGFHHMSAFLAKQMFDELQMTKPKANATVSAPRPLTPRQRELALKRKIKKLTNRRDRDLGLDPGTTNTAIVRIFGKKRPNMTEMELLRVLDWLRNSGYDAA